MPEGLQVWNASGGLEVDTSTWMGRVLGVVPVTGANQNSSLTHSGFVNQRGWYAVTSSNAAFFPPSSSRYLTLDVVINTSTGVMSWSCPHAVPAGITLQLVFGVY